MNYLIVVSCGQSYKQFTLDICNYSPSHYSSSSSPKSEAGQRHKGKTKNFGPLGSLRGKRPKNKKVTSPAFVLSHGPQPPAALASDAKYSTNWSGLVLPIKQAIKTTQQLSEKNIGFDVSKSSRG